MAGEVSHVVLAARVLTRLGEAVRTPAYWAGTLFPNIRHLGIVSRERTHDPQVSLATLIGESDFICGMRVHAWVDMTRSRFLMEANIKELLPWHPLVPHALTLVEDATLYGHFDDWNLIHRVLNKVYEEELAAVHEPQHVRRWHTILQDYIRQPPTYESWLKMSGDLGLSESSAEEINYVVRLLQADPRTGTVLDRMVHHIEYLLQ
ncbi:MAG: hypothetical protein HY372_02490 [Candidatus Andersenbacteria bacterium]|nr:hypothetical protein [Candidatus Andersenbacteria bacterium]